MNTGDNEAVIPVISEEVHAHAVPAQTGGVRVIKRPYTHDEMVELELRKSRVEVKRVKTNRVVDGPQPVRHEGSTTIVPIVSEIVKIEKQFVVTEEIYITQREEGDTFRQNVNLYSEEARIEPLESGAGEDHGAATVK